MINKLFSFLSSGTNIQNNIAVYSSKIETSIKHINRDFNNGDIKQAFEDLNSLIYENDNNSKIKYHLLVNKASFLFSVRKYDEALKLIENIEKNYSQFIDLSFEEVKLIELSLKKQEEEFFNLVDKIISESSKDIESDKFRLMYYLNAKEIDKAKALFESFDDSKKNKEEYSLLGANIYSSFDAHEAKKYHQMALKGNLAFMDKIVIHEYCSINSINKVLLGLNTDNADKEKIQEYKELLEKILKSENYLQKEYVIELKNIYLFVLLVLFEKDMYVKHFNKYKDIDDIFINHYIYYIDLSGEKISHELVQNKILETKNLNLILRYLELLEQPKYQNEILIFLENEYREGILSNSYAQLFYIEAKILREEKIDSDILGSVISKKDESFENLITFLMIQIRNQEKIQEVDIDKLFEYAKKEDILGGLILKTIHIFKNLNYREKYLELTIIKQDVFPKIIEETLVICMKDNNLLINEFETFIDKIKITNNDRLAMIGNVYTKFNEYYKAFDYFYELFKKGREDVELLLALLEASVKYFFKTNDIFDKKREIEIYNKLISKKDELDIKYLIYLLEYSIHILNDTKQILPILNQKLLENNIDSIDNEIKIELSNIYIQIIGVNYDKLFIYDENICYQKDGKTYFTGYECNAENKEKYGLSTIDKNKFLSIKNNPSYTQKSLFHSIVEPFVFRVDNPNMIPIKIDLSSENILSDLTSKITELFGDDKELFEKYSNGDYVGLYTLSKKDYKDYFTLIPYLLNHKKYILNSLKPNFLKEKKKILTVSSIIFLNEINCLDVVLERDGIVIQQTLINWINNYVESYNSLHRPREFSYLDEKEPKFVPYTEEEAKKAKAWEESLKKLLKKLLKCEIIDDTKENLSIASSFELLKGIGKLEYHALAYCVNHNYQIISENNIFEMLFNHFGYNKLFISNSYSILSDILDKDDFLSIQKQLFEKKYQYLSNKPDMNSVSRALRYSGFKNIYNDEIKMLFRIWFEYGYLDELIIQYQHDYKVLYPKIHLPIENIFSRNMDFLLNEVINYNN